MLQLSGTILNRPILSLRTNAQVGTAVEPIINPNNLKIEGFYCLDKFNKKKQRVLLYQDIRDVMPQGIVINDQDAMSDPGELVRLQEVLKLNFQLLGKPVVTVSKTKIGKVNDFAVEVETMFVQKLYVGQSLVKSFTGGSLSIDRSQIVEITSKKIIINDLEETVPLKVPAAA